MERQLSKVVVIYSICGICMGNLPVLILVKAADNVVVIYKVVRTCHDLCKQLLNVAVQHLVPAIPYLCMYYIALCITPST